MGVLQWKQYSGISIVGAVYWEWEQQPTKTGHGKGRHCTTCGKFSSKVAQMFPFNWQKGRQVVQHPKSLQTSLLYTASYVDWLKSTLKEAYSQSSNHRLWPHSICIARIFNFCIRRSHWFNLGPLGMTQLTELGERSLQFFSNLFFTESSISKLH